MVAISSVTQMTTSSVVSSSGVDVRPASPAPQQVKVAGSPPPQAVQEREVTSQEVKKAVEQANREIANNRLSEVIGFGYEEKLNQIYVMVKDAKSGEVIREIPSREFLDHKLAMLEMIGLILDKEA